MKFLIDVPISPKVCQFLNQLGYDSVHAFEVKLAQATDREIIEHAVLEGRIIISMDLDFGTILALSKQRKPGVILFRINTPDTERISAFLKRVVKTYPSDTLGRSITIVEDLRVRIRELPI